MDSKETDNPKANEKDSVLAERVFDESPKRYGFTSISWVGRS